MANTQKIPTTKQFSGEYTGEHQGIQFKVQKSDLVPTGHTGGYKPTHRAGHSWDSSPNWRLHIPALDVHLNGLSGKRHGVNKAVDLIESK